MKCRRRKAEETVFVTMSYGDIKEYLIGTMKNKQETKTTKRYISYLHERETLLA